MDSAVRAGAAQSTDYLGVNLPSEAGGSRGPRNTHLRAQGSLAGIQARPQSSLSGVHARAQSSLSGMLVNPFGGPVDEDGERSHDATPEPELEVDLASWGLDGFIPKDKEKVKTKKRDKGKARESNELPNPYDMRHRSQSVDFGKFGAGDAFLDSSTTPPLAGPTARRRSVSSAMELGGSASSRALLSQRPASAHALIDSLPVTPPLHSVPFPSQSRSASPGPLDALEGPNTARAHGRTYSTASFGSRNMLNDEESGERNPFALDPPSPTRTSRFDPKAARSRTASIASMGSRALLDDFGNDDRDNAFAAPAARRQSSLFDPRAPDTRSRVMSSASLGSRMLLDDGASVMTGAPGKRGGPMSTMDLMRPKVLVMPSPLQGANRGPTAPATTMLREGFQLSLSADGTPLPPGSRAGRSASSLMPNASAAASAVPIASNSFIPNPRATLSLSQLIFRNQLMVDGQRDVAYADIDQGLQRATEDGVQIIATEEEEPVQPVSVVVDELTSRPAGKLFGKSLVDELEERKATMRNKQRYVPAEPDAFLCFDACSRTCSVFYGDSRPSMMSRGSSFNRSSTFIDPTTLIQRPGTQVLETPPLVRRNSSGPKPLLDFEEDGQLAPPRRPGMTNARSVFGVDTLWESEMSKLKEIEAQEVEARKAAEAREAAEAAKKARKKGKGKVRPTEQVANVSPSGAAQVPLAEAEPRVSMAPPLLPEIPRNMTRGAPPPRGDDDDNDTDSDSDSDAGVQRAQTPQWHAGASDDEGGGAGPLRKPGVGPRYPAGHPHASSSAQQQADDDSDEDVPLSATVGRAVQRATRLGLAPGDDDSDEDRPLSRVLLKKKATPAAGGLDINFDGVLGKPAAGVGSDDDEDDQPLGLRASRVLPGDEDEDDKPLALHPQQQQRRTQYQMLALHQQQQQQQAVAAVQQQQQLAMHASMMFSNPSLMNSGYFAPPMMMPMMPPPVTGSPPPQQDPVKLNRVDQWRHGVGVDG
jgi:hypothetical protein